MITQEEEEETVVPTTPHKISLHYNMMISSPKIKLFTDMSLPYKICRHRKIGDLGDPGF